MANIFKIFQHVINRNMNGLFNMFFFFFMLSLGNVVCVLHVQHVAVGTRHISGAQGWHPGPHLDHTPGRVQLLRGGTPAPNSSCRRKYQQRRREGGLETPLPGPRSPLPTLQACVSVSALGKAVRGNHNCCSGSLDAWINSLVFIWLFINKTKI